jgi:hypothetical protein
MESGTVEEAIPPPFEERHEALQGLRDTLPDHPTIPLSDRAAVTAFLKRELSTERLRDVYPLLFLASNFENISPLHHQVIKGRRILLTERADLHLVWTHDRIFIKPLPRCLLSYSFWTAHLHPRPAGATTTKTRSGERAVAAAAAIAPTSVGPQSVDHLARLRLEAQGFLRTYARLITHESDFDLALKLRLLPPDCAVDWPAWCHFIQGFGLLRDGHVAPRYHYGEIRLARLNFANRVLLRGTYFDACHSYGTFFAGFAAPYLLIYGAVAVVLAALQNAVQIDPEGSYRNLALDLVPVSIALTALGLVSFPVLYTVFLLKELFLFVFCHQSLSM